MELRHLAHFVAVAEHGSFTRAAADVHVVQSALSVSIRSLERELGTRLFDRTTHRVVLTDAGQVLLVEARKTLAAADAARDAVTAVHGGLRGRLRVGIMHSLGLVDLAGLLTRFHAERPHVRIEPSPARGGSAELVKAVADGTLDVAFAAVPGAYPATVRGTPLTSEPMGLVCPPDHPLAARKIIRLSELDRQPFLDFPVGWGTRTSVDQLFLQHGLSRTVAIEIADIYGLTELVRAGFGIAFLSPSLLGSTRGLPLHTVRPHPSFSVALVQPNNRTLSPAAQAFVDLTLARRDLTPAHRRGVADVSRQTE